MQVAVRADASLDIGSGHIMRCLTLADGLREAGAEVTFFCQKQRGSLEDLVGQRGYRVIRVADDREEPLPAALDQIRDAQHCRDRLPAVVDLLVVDHYRLDRRWEKLLRDRTKRLMVIDDLADRHHDCDLLLDQNLLPEMDRRYRGLVPADCRMLLGPEYALLRAEFFNRTAGPRTRTELKRLLIFFGGMDRDNLTGRTLRELRGIDCAAEVVIGSGNPHREEIDALCLASEGRWTLHVQTERMAELIHNCDLAIGAGGSSHWERCRLGLPALVVTVAENQVETTRLLQQRGACRWLGSPADLRPGAILNQVKTLTASPQQLTTSSKAASAVLSGQPGTTRVVNEILKCLKAG